MSMVFTSYFDYLVAFATSAQLHAGYCLPRHAHLKHIETPLWLVDDYLTIEQGFDGQFRVVLTLQNHSQWHSRTGFEQAQTAELFATDIKNLVQRLQRGVYCDEIVSPKHKLLENEKPTVSRLCLLSCNRQTLKQTRRN